MGLSAACSAPLQASGHPDTCDSFTHPCPWALGLFPALVLRVQRCDCHPCGEGAFSGPHEPGPCAWSSGSTGAPPQGGCPCRLMAHSPLAAAQGREGPQQVSLVSRPDAGSQSAMLRRGSRTSFLYSQKFPSERRLGHRHLCHSDLSARGTHSSWIPRNGVAGSQDRHVRTRLSEIPPKGFPRWFSKSTRVITKPRFRCSCILTNVWNCPSF